MTTLEAGVLGIVQGLTEFLPISSTGHLRIVPVLFHWDDPGPAFSAVIQIGTLAAVLMYFWNDMLRLLRGTITGISQGQPFTNPDSRLAWMIAAGSIPIVVVGLKFKDQIKSDLRGLDVVASALIGLALLLIVAEWVMKRRQRRGEHEKELEQITWMDALLIGLAQAFALIPGTSRSGVTITAALFLGLSRYTAARFSFLLSLPAIFGAGVYQLYEEWRGLTKTQQDVMNLILATVVSGVVGYAAIAFLLRYLQKHSTWLFIIYRIALGLFLFGLLTFGS